MSAVLFKKLQDLAINYTLYEHEPLFTAEQALRVSAGIPGAKCKNLFLKDSKGNVYLIVAVHDTQIHLRQLSKYLKAPELRFAQPDLLKEYLGVEPGSVTPFGLINDTEHKVSVILDARIFEHQTAGFHPLVNTATIVIATADLKKFVETCGNKYHILDFNAVAR